MTREGPEPRLKAGDSPGALTGFSYTSVPQSHAQRDLELHVSHQLRGRGKDTPDRFVGMSEKTNKQTKNMWFHFSVDHE